LVSNLKALSTSLHTTLLAYYPVAPNLESTQNHKFSSILQTNILDWSVLSMLDVWIVPNDQCPVSPKALLQALTPELVSLFDCILSVRLQDKSLPVVRIIPSILLVLE